MFTTHNTSSGQRRGGFTLVEILIVVIILGILAAIVLPQFTTASADARKNSLQSQLQTIRSQIQLYAAQHFDLYPSGLATAGSLNPWNEMVTKTDSHGNPGTDFGPYLQAAPRNALNSYTSVAVVSGMVPGTGDFGRGHDDLGAAYQISLGQVGWIFNSDNGRVWATSQKAGYTFNEDNAAADTNAQ